MHIFVFLREKVTQRKLEEVSTVKKLTVRTRNIYNIRHKLT